jgi:metal-responsive CopG/Arc/MetJ family transcriptional regulator
MSDGVKFTIEFPKNITDALDKEAAEIGISRASLIKVIVAKHIKENP